MFLNTSEKIVKAVEATICVYVFDSSSSKEKLTNISLTYYEILTINILITFIK